MPRPKRYNASQRTSTTIIDDGGSAPANVLLRLRESTSAVDLSKLDKYGLEPELSQRVASFADDFNAGHADDSLVRSLLRQYAAAASQVLSEWAMTIKPLRAMLELSETDDWIASNGMVLYDKVRGLF